MLHANIYNDLLKKIINEEYKENDKLPSEPELQSFYGVSRITVRRAIQDLQNDGYVEKLRGKGTIIKNKKISLNLQKLDSFTNESQGKGVSTTSELIRFEEIIPKERVKNRLKLGKNEKCYYIERIRKVFNLKIGVQRTYIVKNRGIKLNKKQFNENTSLYNLIKNCGININHAIENIEVRYADETIKKLLDLNSNLSLFYRERISYDKDNYLIEYSEMYYRSDEYKYIIKLQIDNNNK